MDKAPAVQGAVVVVQAVTVGQIGWVYVPLDGDDPVVSFRRSPAAITYEGRRYGKSAFDSDKGIIVYRTDRAVAQEAT
jgi:hypothetical protein